MWEFVEFAVVGKLAIFILQRFPFRKLPLIGRWFEDGKFFSELFECDLCLGVWVYSALAILLQFNIFGIMSDIPILSWILTGMATSFIMHVFSTGWKALFGVTVIGGD